MSYNTLKISKVMEKISSNELVLPSIQREYVWNNEQIETLFDSLMQGYPIGTFLFWEIDKEYIGKFDFYEFLRNYHERDSRHNKKIDLKGYSGKVTSILDGQQRLTSIYIALKGTYTYKLKYKRNNNDNAYPARKLYLNLLSEAKDNDKKYDFRFLIPNDVKNDENNYWFEVGKILDMKDGDSYQYVFDNITYSKDDIIYTKEKASIAVNTLGRLYNIIKSEELINYYEESTTDLDKVLDIFVRINKGGTKLSHSDLLLSIASAQWNTYDARKGITEFVDEVNSIGKGFKIDKDFVLKAMLVLTGLDVAFKVKNFNKENMQKIEWNWDNIQRAIRQTMYLVSSFGYSGETLSSNNALIPIAYYLFNIGNPMNFVSSNKYSDDRKKIKQWLISVLLKKQFSGHPDNVIRTTRTILSENTTDQFPFETILEKFKGTDKSIIFTDDDIDEYLLNLRYGKSETLSTLMLLYPSLDFANNFHIDHMYPKSKFNKAYLSKMGVSAEDIPKYIDAVNDISNLQLLDGIANEEKNDKDFDKWFNEKYRTESEREEQRNKHYMPNMEYSYLNFMDYINQRREIIKSKLIELLK